MPHRRRMAHWKLSEARRMRRNPTPAEAFLWMLFRKKQMGVKIRRQELCAGYILDFYCPVAQIAIEADGPIHNRNLDDFRDRALARYGIKVLRFTNQRIFTDTASVLKEVQVAIIARLLNPDEAEQLPREAWGP